MRHAAASPDNIDITTLFASIGKNAMRVVALAVAAGVLTYVGLSLIAPRYASQAEVSIRSTGLKNPFTSPNNGGNASGVITSQVDKPAVNTHVLALQSPDLLTKVANDLQLNRKREFNSALGPLDTMSWLMNLIGFGSHNPNESERDRVLSSVFERLVVYSPVDSRLISIGFSSADPQLAADIANSIAHTYRSRLIEATMTETGKIQQSLKPKIEHLTAEVRDAEAAAAQFRAKSGLMRGGATKTPLNEQQLGDLTTELTRASGSRSALQASAAKARELIRRGTPEVIPEVQRSPLVQNLIQQRVAVERNLRKVSATMKPAHPIVRELNADLASVKREIMLEVANVVASIEKEAQVAVEREASVKRSLDEIKKTVTNNSGAKAEADGYDDTARSKRAELERLLAQFEANRAAAEGGAVPVAVEILTEAQPASIAVYPKKVPFSLLVTTATLLFGMAIVISSALLKGARPQKSNADTLSNDIASATAHPIPTLQMSAPNSNPPRVTPTQRTLTKVSELSAAVASHAARTQTPCRTMIVARTNRLRAGHLGRELGGALMGEGQNTIVVDWNTRGQSAILADYNVKPMTGITDLIQGTARFGDVLRALPDNNTHAIACGTPISEGQKIDPAQVSLILDALDATYDQIVIVANPGHARELFETIEGRIDVGVWAEEPHLRGVTKPATEPEGTFLGFKVADLPVYQFTPSATVIRAAQTATTRDTQAASPRHQVAARAKPAA